MIRTQSGPDSRYLYVVAPKPKTTRRVRWASTRETVNRGTSRLFVAEEERSGSFAKAVLIGLPISAALWAVIIGAAIHFL